MLCMVSRPVARPFKRGGLTPGRCSDHAVRSLSGVQGIAPAANAFWAQKSHLVVMMLVIFIRLFLVLAAGGGVNQTPQVAIGVVSNINTSWLYSTVMWMFRSCKICQKILLPVVQLVLLVMIVRWFYFCLAYISNVSYLVAVNIIILQLLFLELVMIGHF